MLQDPAIPVLSLALEAQQKRSSKFMYRIKSRYVANWNIVSRNTIMLGIIGRARFGELVMDVSI